MTDAAKPAPAPLDPPTFDEQLRRWVLGDPVHLPAPPDASSGDGGSCCPDFSCCRPELLAEPEIRRAFAAASDADRMPFLGTFLGAMIELASKEREARGGKPLAVHIAGRDPDREA